MFKPYFCPFVKTSFSELVFPVFSLSLACVSRCHLDDITSIGIKKKKKEQPRSSFWYQLGNHQTQHVTTDNWLWNILCVKILWLAIEQEMSPDFTPMFHFLILLGRGEWSNTFSFFVVCLFVLNTSGTI